MMMVMTTLHQLGVLCLNIWQSNSGAKEPTTTTSRRRSFAKTWRPRRRRGCPWRALAGHLLCSPPLLQAAQRHHLRHSPPLSPPFPSSNYQQGPLSTCDICIIVGFKKYMKLNPKASFKYVFSWGEKHCPPPNYRDIGPQYRFHCKTTKHGGH